jgi:hypothetical protein
LTLRRDGTLVGKPTQAGAYEFTVEAVNPVGIQFADANVTIAAKRSSKAACAGRAAQIVGRAGGDRLVGTRRGDVIVGGSGNDRVLGRGGGDLVCAGDGNDRVVGGGGNDRLSGQAGNDILLGGPGRDVLNGGRGNDRLQGGRGTDRVNGGPGNDRIDPGSGRDQVSAGAGNDRIFSVDGQRDVIDCGPGRDVAIVDAVDRVRRCETVVRVTARRGRQVPAPRTGLG